MENYTLKSGAWETQIIAEDIDKAKEMADIFIGYNQESMSILDGQDNTLVCRSWIGCIDEFMDECDNPIQFGDCGYYTDWVEI